MQKRRKVLQTSPAACAVSHVVRLFCRSGSGMVLNGAAMQEVKRFGREGKVGEMYLALATHIRSDRAKVRLASLLIACDLFDRSQEFRVVFVQDIRLWSEYCLGSNLEKPLPDASGLGHVLKVRASQAFRHWHNRYASSNVPSNTNDYRKQLDMAFKTLNDKGILVAEEGRVNQAPLLELPLKSRVEAVITDLNDAHSSISINLLEAENAMSVLLPSFSERFGGEEVDEESRKADADLLFVDELGALDVADEQMEWEEEEEEEGERAPPKDDGKVSADTFVSGISNDYSIHVVVPAQIDLTEENEPVVRALREALKVLNVRHLPKLVSWRDLLSVDGSANEAMQKIDDLIARADHVNKLSKLIKTL